MKKFPLYTVMVLAALVTMVSCSDPNPVSKLYSESAIIADQPAKWAGTQPSLNSMPDSAAYLMGYVYGGNLRQMIEDGRLPETKRFDRKDVERGFALALEADSATLGTLYGIMRGLELRFSMDQLQRETGIDWNAQLVYKGFYQGLNATVPSSLPVPMAEEQLNRLLRPYFTDGN